MNIRKATSSDIPAIVELLRLSLGESLIKKTEDTWRWKHEDNPFGPSPVLLAEDEGQIIGVRAMMRWQFEMGGKTYKAVRAVDTATHPDHQGKGIFKKLTLDLIEQLKEEGCDFIFNTPNEKSKPGYLKMGWEELYRIPIRIKPKLFLSKGINKQEFFIDEFRWPEIEPHKMSYYRWRYAENPMETYFQLHFHDGVAFFRVKKGEYFNELRICDIEAEGDFTRSFRSALKKAMNTYNARLATIGVYSSHLKKYLDRVGFFPEIERGLTLTGRELQMNPKNYFNNRDLINLELGTYELF